MSKSYVWSNQSQHLRNWSVDLEEDTIVELLQTEQLEYLSGLGGHLVDTDKSSNKKKLSFGLNEEVSAGSCLTSETNKVSLASMILLQVLDRTRLQFSALSRVNLVEIYNNSINSRHTLTFFSIASVFNFRSFSF